MGVKDDVVLLIAGDTFPTASNEQLFKEGRVEEIFGKKIVEIFNDADYRICNLEGVLTDKGEPIDKSGPVIRASADAIEGIKRLGVDCATLGNTHSMDYGKEGFEHMCQVLEDNGIEYFGWGKSKDAIVPYKIIEKNGHIIGLYNVTEQFENAPKINSPGVNLYDEYRVCEELKELKEKSDFLIVFYHGGIELSHYCDSEIRRRFHAMSQCGADVIISQHTHSVGEEIYYGNTYCLYGQGNFCFNTRREYTEHHATGILLKLQITEAGINISKILVRRTETGCEYDEMQDFTEFNSRSDLLYKLENGDEAANAIYEEAFSRVSADWKIPFFKTVSGNNEIDAKVFSEMSKEQLGEYIKLKYNKKQILVLLMFLRNDEYREMAIRMLEDLLKEY